jgi:hypothetical protein
MLSVWSYSVALISGAITTQLLMLFAARVGVETTTNQLLKTIAGAINSGRPVANLNVSDLVSSSHALSLDRWMSPSSSCGVMML